jgi:hypothetical protein
LSADEFDMEDEHLEIEGAMCGTGRQVVYLGTWRGLEVAIKTVVFSVRIAGPFPFFQALQQCMRVSGLYSFFQAVQQCMQGARVQTDAVFCVRQGFVCTCRPGSVCKLREDDGALMLPGIVAGGPGLL